MTNLDDIIKYEPESGTLDFKRESYTKEKHVDLLKDIIAMANSHLPGKKYIITGVQLNPDGTRNYLGISLHPDEATYQQLVSNNIEPELGIKYYSYPFEGTSLGIIEISEANNRPYMMKKDYGSGTKLLSTGDSFIRKGSHQKPLSRNDIDEIYSSKNSSLSGNDIDIFFAESSSTTQKLLKVDPSKLPSNITRKTINDIIQSRKSTGGHRYYTSARPGVIKIARPYNPKNKDYDNMSINELFLSLNNVDEMFLDDDMYSREEEQANKINFRITNNGKQYIDDVTIRVFFPNIESIVIRKDICSKDYQSKLINMVALVGSTYPKVEDNDGQFIITENLGSIKHGIPVLAFKDSLRLIVQEGAENKVLDVKILLHGKNLPAPIEKHLKMVIE